MYFLTIRTKTSEFLAIIVWPMVNHLKDYRRKQVFVNV